MQRNKKKNINTVEALLCDMLIVQLGLAGIPQPEIRKIVGVDMVRVNRIVKPLKKFRK